MTTTTDPTTASSGGQEPSAGQGQAPSSGQVTQAATTTTTTQQQQSPSSSSAATTVTQTPEQLAADLARLTKELADTRKEAAQHRTELKKFQDAQLTDQQKLEQRATEAEAARDAYKARIASYEVRMVASKLGIIDPELAAMAIQAQLEYESDGTPKNAEKLLRELLTAKPYLAASGGAGATTTTTRGTAQSGGATNPGAAARTGTFTREQVAQMSPAEYAANRDAIMKQLNANKGRL